MGHNLAHQRDSYIETINSCISTKTNKVISIANVFAAELQLEAFCFVKCKKEMKAHSAVCRSAPLVLNCTIVRVGLE